MADDDDGMSQALPPWAVQESFSSGGGSGSGSVEQTVQTAAPHTDAPTDSPTEEVTEAPTEEVTEAATEAPTVEVTEAPTVEVTEAATEAPSQTADTDTANIAADGDAPDVNTLVCDNSCSENRLLSLVSGDDCPAGAHSLPACNSCQVSCDDFCAAHGECGTSSIDVGNCPGDFDIYTINCLDAGSWAIAVDQNMIVVQARGQVQSKVYFTLAAGGMLCVMGITVLAIERQRRRNRYERIDNRHDRSMQQLEVAQ
jgi:hypothetical protein